MLNYFLSSKQAELKQLEDLNLTKDTLKPYTGKRVNFIDALASAAQAKGLAIIAEYKRASPSLGDIDLDVAPEMVAQSYALAGATAISVLTEETKFKGSLAFIDDINSSLAGKMPLLRKDFIFHPLQILATAQTPASAVLLIVKLTPQVQLLKGLRELAESYGIDAVVEVFDLEDLELARESGAKIIQVNARNLNTFTTDRATALELAKKYKNQAKKPEIWIAASGIEKAQDLKESQDAGFDAVLIGTSLMKAGNLQEALSTLLKDLKTSK